MARPSSPTPAGPDAVDRPADRTAMRPVVAAAVSTRRGAELAMLAFAALLTTGALVLVEANQQQRLTLPLLYLGLAFLGAYGVAHVTVRLCAPYADPLLLPCVALLNGLGLVMIHRIDLARIARAVGRGDPELPGQDALKQVGWVAAGIVLFVAVLFCVRDHRTLSRFGYTAGFVGLVLLVLPAVLPSALSEVNGAKIWVRVGPVGLQPGEFAKILLVIFFASFLVTKRDVFTTAGKRFLGMTFPRPRDLGPLLVAWGVSMGVLVFESDLGTSLMFFGIVLSMIYVATERSSWVIVGLAFFAAGAFTAWTFVSRVQLRVEVWLHPLGDTANTSYQVSQGLFGLATGGVGGTGLGAGRPDLVPLSSTDFIITSMGEELGLVGLAGLFLLYFLVSARALRTALAVRDTFGKLLAAGLGFTIAIQVFVVAGGVIGLIPNTGQAAPFMSYGGSSLVANYALVALVLRVSDAARRPATERSGPAAGPAAPLAPLAEAHTEMVPQDRGRAGTATPPHGSAPPGAAAGGPPPGPAGAPLRGRTRGE